jgi:histone acetyltransferase (RNA polymerase elongator complex component)
LERIKEAELKIRQYEASGGMEYFISMETPDEKYIYGFCRLRLSSEMGYVDSIEPKIRKGPNIMEKINLYSNMNHMAMIRELHVYGDMTPVSEDGIAVQHRGFGKKMLKCAEKIAMDNGYVGMAIISGVGARRYYEKHGYYLENDYMAKFFGTNYFDNSNCIGLILTFVPLIIVILAIFFY